MQRMPPLTSGRNQQSWDSCCNHLSLPTMEFFIPIVGTLFKIPIYNNLGLTLPLWEWVSFDKL